MTTTDSPLDSSEVLRVAMGYEDTGPDAEQLGVDGQPTAPKAERTAHRRYVVTAEDSALELTYQPGGFMLYSPPRQRQRWGEAQVLPRVNWGDLFFDLFYVAATYNVSNILSAQPNRTGLLYAAGTFWPVMAFWLQKTMYDARFVFEDDLYHRCMEILGLMILGTAVVHIQPVKVMSNPKYIDMFIFAFMILLLRCLTIVYYMEVYFLGVGQKVNMKGSAINNMAMLFVSGLVYLAASTVAGRDYFQTDGDAHHVRILGTAEVATAEESHNATDATETDTTTGNSVESHQEPHSDTPIQLMFAGYIFLTLLLTAQIVFCLPSGGRHKESTVPLNIDFFMNRNAEWTMLMLGASIFSLLTASVPESRDRTDYYVTFFTGIMTVVFLYYLHFESQPRDSDSHATRRDKNAGVLWGLFQQLYSLALVALGAVFTDFLNYYAGVKTVDVTMKADATRLFCHALATVFFSLDVMCVLHVGFYEGRARCVCPRSKRVQYPVLILALLRLAVVCFTSTIYRWETNPMILSLIGLACVLVELLLRRFGIKYASHSAQVAAAS